MSLSVNNLIFHQINLDKDNLWHVQHRKSLLKKGTTSDDLVVEIHRVFNSKPAKGFAFFKEKSKMNQLLNDFENEKIDFVELSNLAVEKLKDELLKYSFIKPGILVMTQYQSLATEYLFIGLLNSKDSLKITADLELDNTAYLDVSKMDVAVRVDLSTWRSDKESQRYIGFIKGRVGRKIGDFFFDFLEAEEGMNVKEQNQVLFQAVDDFCADAQLDKNEQQLCKENVYKYCREQVNNGEELKTQEIAQELPQTRDGVNFNQFVEHSGYEIEDSFPVDRASMRKFKKFIGSGGGLSISFDASLLGEKIIYDPKTDTLVINGIPPNLKNQLSYK